MPPLILTSQALEQLVQRTGRPIVTFADYLAAIDWLFTTYGARAVGVKLAINYWRRLDFRPRSREEAEAAFAQQASGEAPRDPRAFEDFVFFHVAALAAAHDLPLRFHCGFTAGITPLLDVRPTHLEPVFAARTANRFVLLHAGYPFLHETIALCQAYPHVYADLGWIWQIDPVWSERFVREFVTACGPRQLLLFGGDTGFAETAFAYSLGARQGLARALTTLRRDGLVEAVDVDHLIARLMVENARECFRLADKFKL
jgi:hypothetical protein